MKTLVTPRGDMDAKLRLPNVTLRGDFIVPPEARGVVLFAHGSGSSRKSTRNRFVAKILHENRIGTLLFDLLTESEEEEDARTAHLRFNIHLLSQRLKCATEWLLDQTGPVPLGYFGASTGAAAALIAAAQLSPAIEAVVSRGGRPDLAGLELRRVTAPTLLIVGGHDYPVIELNERAYRELQCEKHLEIIPGATHLFEEPGTLAQAADRAAHWFKQHLGQAAAAA